MSLSLQALRLPPTMQPDPQPHGASPRRRRSQSVGRVPARDRSLATQAGERLRSALSSKGQNTLRLALIGGVGGDFVALDMPRDALSALERVLALMSAGHAVNVSAVASAVTPAPVRLSTQQVATALGVSRPFVIAEIFAGRMTCTTVGRHRRMAPEEVERYRSAHMVRPTALEAPPESPSASTAESTPPALG